MEPKPRRTSSSSNVRFSVYLEWVQDEISSPQRNVCKDPKPDSLSEKWRKQNNE
jgi:hypothetical protein